MIITETDYYTHDKAAENEDYWKIMGERLFSIDIEV
jgi:hypothetical protein